MDFSQVSISSVKQTASDTPEQLTAIDAMAHADTHVAVEALAGTGKTTVAIKAASETPAVCKFFAFSRDAVNELVSRGVAPRSARTLNSASYKVVRDNNQGMWFDVDKKRLYKITLAATETASAYGNHLGELMSLVRYCKSQGVVPLSLCDSVEAKTHNEKLVNEFVGGQGLRIPNLETREVAQFVMSLLEECATVTPELDFDDQVWWPYIHRMKVRTEAERGIVDEAQDMSWPQHYVATRLADQVSIIGDRNQAIYGWRGASHENFAKTIADLEATVHPLTVSWRCAQAIIAEAQKFVPEIKAAPNASQGQVSTIELAQLAGDIQPRDFVISRNNADLFAVWTSLVREGKPAYILGNAITKLMKTVVQRWKFKGGKLSFLEYLSKWEQESVATAQDAGADSGKFVDVARSLLTLYTFAEYDVQTVLRLLSQAESGDVIRNGITLGTTHRMKGKEASRVYRLNNYASATSSVENRNLAYVSVTRAKQALVYVNMPSKGGQ